MITAGFEEILKHHLHVIGLVSGMVIFSLSLLDSVGHVLCRDTKRAAELDSPPSARCFTASSRQRPAQITAIICPHHLQEK